MVDAPPTVRGPMAPRVNAIGLKRVRAALIGAAIHCGCVVMACFVVPLALRSNIWPIAGVFWSVLTSPAALVTGILTGLVVRKRELREAVPILVFTGIGLAIAVGIWIVNSE